MCGGYTGGGRITSSSSVTASSRNKSLSLSLSLSPSLSSVTVPPTTRRISHILHRNKRYSIPVCNIVQLTCLGSGTVCSAVQHPKHAQVAFKDTSSYVACDNGVYSGVVSSLYVGVAVLSLGSGWFYWITYLLYPLPSIHRDDQPSPSCIHARAP